jgi:hypothetical protein
MLSIGFRRHANLAQRRWRLAVVFTEQLSRRNLARRLAACLTFRVSTGRDLQEPASLPAHDSAAAPAQVGCQVIPACVLPY